MFPNIILANHCIELAYENGNNLRFKNKNSIVVSGSKQLALDENTCFVVKTIASMPF